MTITIKSIKILWAAAGGRCSYADCWERLCHGDADEYAPFTIGEMAHICGDKPGANRHDASQSDSERDDYKNLILLCPTHHTLIDKKENEKIYTVGLLHEIKKNHEKRILNLLDNKNTLNKTQFANDITQLLEENKQTWLQYGPISKLAQSHPHSKSIQSIWESERLAIIVPNNRKISKALDDYGYFFSADEVSIIKEFQLHVRSYENWVNDRTPYSAVKRFPERFEQLMKGISSGIL